MTRKPTLKTCFVIAPIDVEGSDVRRRSDNVLKYIIQPVTLDCGYKATRADEISQPGIIAHQIIQHILEDDLVIADLTDGNPNVYYELALRHAIRKPCVLIAQSQDPLPFDVASARTILFHEADASIDNCKQELAKQIKAIEQNPASVDSPISVAIDILQLCKSGNLVEKSNAEILSMLQDMRGEFVKTLREQSGRISELQSRLAINAQNDLKDQSSSMGIMQLTGSSVSKEMYWDNFISGISLFDRTNLVELLDDLVRQNTFTYMPDIPHTYKSHTHGTYSTYSGFQISTESNGDYKITQVINTFADYKTINVSKDDLRTFRDYVARRGIYAGGAELRLGDQWRQ